MFGGVSETKEMKLHHMVMGFFTLSILFMAVSSRVMQTGRLVSVVSGFVAAPSQVTDMASADDDFGLCRHMTFLPSGEVENLSCASSTARSVTPGFRGFWLQQCRSWRLNATFRSTACDHP